MAYSSKSQFNRIDEVQNIKDLDDAKRVINSLVKTFNDTHGKLNTEFRELGRSASGSTAITIVNGTGTSRGGSGSAGASQGGKKVITSIASATSVTFTSAFGTLNYVLWVWGFNSAGDVIGVTTSDLTLTGFKVLPLEPCDVFYIVQPYTP